VLITWVNSLLLGFKVLARREGHDMLGRDQIRNRRLDLGRLFRVQQGLHRQGLKRTWVFLLRELQIREWSHHLQSKLSHFKIEAK
jgi:hypothetical protein